MASAASMAARWWGSRAATDGAVVDAAEGVQFGVVETLDAERQAGDAGFGVALKTGLLESAGVGFEGDFGFGLQAH